MDNFGSVSIGRHERPRLTAQDVRYATFGKPPWGKRGYNEEEADTFLEALEATIAGLDDRV